MAEARDQEFLEFIVKELVDHPNDVKVSRTIDEKGVLLKLDVNPEDMGKVIGKDGNTAKAIRLLLHIVGLKNQSLSKLKINEPEGRTRPVSARESVDQAMEDLKM